MSTGVLHALFGGGLIGLAAALLMHTIGRIAGISGIVSGLFTPREGQWRLWFLAGLGVGGGLLALFWPSAFSSNTGYSMPRILLAGFLVGFGALLGSGCTSGHGVCGISRFSVRSLVATATFMATAIITVLLLQLWQV